MAKDEPNSDPSLPDLVQGVASHALADNQSLLGTVAGEKVLLVRTQGKLFTVGATCTHLGGPLEEGLLVGGEVRCPWHHARFALDSGEAVGAPAFDALPSYAVQERDGRIVVSGPGAAAQEHPAGTPPERILIVGGGAAGFACAQWLARAGFGRHVTLLSDDADPPYDRTFCSKAYLAGNATREALSLAPADFYGDNGPRFIRARAVSIDAEAREVVTEDGKRHTYDALVLATGAEPKRPELPGFDGPDVHLLRTLADADTLIAAAQTGQRAAIVGAGFIGLEVAASLTQRGLDVAVVAPDDVPLAHVLGQDIGRMVRAVHEENGVHFYLGRSVRRYEDGKLVLDDGSTMDADFVVAGIGVAPRVELAEAAGLALAPKEAGGGIAVNARLETSEPGIYAVGDVAHYPDPYSGGQCIRVEHWVHAQRQGQHVARVLMGEAEAYHDIAFFWSAHFDIKLRYLGHTDQIAHTEVEGDIRARDFAVRLRDGGHGEAFVACKRDLRALQEEQRREQRLTDTTASRAKPFTTKEPS